MDPIVDEPRVFSWRAILMAPLVVPVLASAALVAGTETRSPWAGFLFFAAAGAVVSYGATVCLLVPSLLIARRRMAVTTLRSTALGAVLGAGLLVPTTWLSWTASGPDSGPPQDTLLAYAARQITDPFNWFFPAAGAFTAGLYWLLLKRSQVGRGGTPQS